MVSNNLHLCPAGIITQSSDFVLNIISPDSEVFQHSFCLKVNINQTTTVHKHENIKPSLLDKIAISPWPSQ